MKLFIAILLSSTMTLAARTSDLKMLVGCWQGQTDFGSMSEIWLTPTENMVIGLAQTKDSAGLTVSEEYLPVRKTVAGELILSPLRNGEKAVDFMYSTLESSMSSTVQKVVFANLQHDFPKRISYQIENAKPQLLSITLQGHDHDLNELVIQYDLKKVDCNEL